MAMVCHKKWQWCVTRNGNSVSQEMAMVYMSQELDNTVHMRV